MQDSTNHHQDDGIDRRGFLKCMAWAGTGVVCSFLGGQASSQTLPEVLAQGGEQTATLRFVQISDSHIGFSKDANPDVTGTLQAAVDRINRLSQPPAFLLHTGDLTHLNRAAEFDAVAEILKGARLPIFYVPGEHDVAADGGKLYLERYGRGTRGAGWYSFEHSGVHFVGLVNVVQLQAGGLGQLGEAQLKWLADDLRGLSNETPVVVFAHIPLWEVYPAWGWGTQDGARALALLKRFGSVTVLNGHVHQVLQKVEGKVTFHTAMATGFPQPQPGKAPSPGPMKVPAQQLRSMLGITRVSYRESQSALALMDQSLASQES